MRQTKFRTISLKERSWCECQECELTGRNDWNILISYIFQWLNVIRWMTCLELGMNPNCLYALSIFPKILKCKKIFSNTKEGNFLNFTLSFTFIYLSGGFLSFTPTSNWSRRKRREDAIIFKEFHWTFWCAFHLVLQEVYCDLWKINFIDFYFRPHYTLQ